MVLKAAFLSATTWGDKFHSMPHTVTVWLRSGEWSLKTEYLRRQRTLYASQSGCAPRPSLWCERRQNTSAHNSGKIGQQPIGDDHTELRLPTSHNSSALTTVASNGVRGSTKDERAPMSINAQAKRRSCGAEKHKKQVNWHLQISNQ